MILESRHWLMQFQREHCEKSFALLVKQFSSLVYSTALRLVGGDVEMAKDVTQAVFIDLARKAGTLEDDVLIGGWLHRHTFFVASKHVRSERRRRTYESKAAAMNSNKNDDKKDYELVAPILDEAVNNLKESDRSVILLRYYQELNYHEIGSILGTSEDATRMRIKRALGKLQSLLTRKGVTLTPVSLGVLLATHTLQAVPISLGASLAATALTGAATQTGILNSILNMLQLTHLKTGLASAVVTAAIVAPVTIQQQKQKADKSAETYLAQIGELEKRQAAFESKITSFEENEELPQEQFRELLRLRGEVGPLREKVKTMTADNEKMRNEMMAIQKEFEKFFQSQLNEDTEKARVQKQGLQKMNAAKSIALGAVMFASENNGTLPETIDAATSMLDLDPDDPNTEDRLSALENWKDHFEFVYQGVLEELASPSKMIILREKEASQNHVGAWYRTYAFGDGHSEIHYSNTPEATE